MTQDSKLTYKTGRIRRNLTMNELLVVVFLSKLIKCTNGKKQFLVYAIYQTTHDESIFDSILLLSVNPFNIFTKPIVHLAIDFGNCHNFCTLRK